MRAILSRLVQLHAAFFGGLEAALGSWLPGLFARLAFGLVLAGYYWQAALGRFAAGLWAPTRITGAAYAEVLPLVAQAYGAAGRAVPAMPWALVVAAVSWAEIVLPVLILLGLGTRLAALGMMLAVLAGSLAERLQPDASPLPGALGGLLDGDPAGFLDQRLLWLVPLTALAIRGGGRASLDRLIGPRLAAAARQPGQGASR